MTNITPARELTGRFQGEALLEVTGLTIDLVRGAHAQPGLVQDVSFDVRAGETVALIGESGCGKTMTAMAVLGLLPAAVRVVAGAVAFEGRDLIAADDRAVRAVRGRSIGAVFQDPMSSLDPTMTVGDQIAESRTIHMRESKRVARSHAVDLLHLVGIPNPQQRARAYPYEFSGGMQQRVMIAAAIACEPKLLVADEPTTALDVTVQAEILDLLADLQQRLGMGLLLVTHDLGVVAEVAERVVVMYAGHVVERADVSRLFGDATHPYTRALLASIPQAGVPHVPLEVIAGRVPPAGAFPAGCRFHPRCPHVREGECTTSTIPLRAITTSGTHVARCVLVDGPTVEEVAR